MTEVLLRFRASASFRYFAFCPAYFLSQRRAQFANIIGRYFFHSSISWRKRRCCSSWSDACSSAAAPWPGLAAYPHGRRRSPCARKGPRGARSFVRACIFGCCVAACGLRVAHDSATGGFRPAELGSQYSACHSAGDDPIGLSIMAFNGRGAVITVDGAIRRPALTIEDECAEDLGRTTDGGHFVYLILPRCF